MKSKKIVLNVVIYIFLVFMLFVTLLPIFYTILGSFKSNAEIMVHPDSLIPLEFTLENYQKAVSNDDFNIPRMLWNSTWYTVISMMITVFLATITGYVFARGGNFPGNRLIFGVFTALMFVNVGSITIYPKFEVLRLVHLNSSLWGLLVMKFFGVGIANIYIVRGFIWSLPKELDEAAGIDGCGFVGTFFKVIMPLLKPVIATLSILAFTGAWNDYLYPSLFTITRKDQRTLTVGIMTLKRATESSTDWGILLAGATVSLVPVLIVYAFCNRFFVEGIAQGAVKG